jgi:hypothetical protein
MNVESALAKALGRAPTAHEKQVLAGLMEAFAIRENDGILPVLATLMRLDAAYRPVPERLTALAQKLEKALDQRLLPAAGTRAAGWRRWRTGGRLTMTFFVVFAAGAVVGAAAMALALRPLTAVELARNVAWLIVPVLATYAGVWGWELAHDQHKPTRHRRGGWGVLIASCAAIAVWLAFVDR